MKVFGTLNVDGFVIARSKVPVLYVVCSDLVKKATDFSPETYEAIGKASIKELERLVGDVSEPMSEV